MKETPGWEWAYKELVRKQFLAEVRRTLRSMRFKAWMGNQVSYDMLKKHLAHIMVIFQAFMEDKIFADISNAHTKDTREIKFTEHGRFGVPENE